MLSPQFNMFYFCFVSKSNWQKQSGKEFTDYRKSTVSCDQDDAEQGGRATCSTVAQVTQAVSLCVAQQIKEGAGNMAAER